MKLLPKPSTPLCRRNTEPPPAETSPAPRATCKALATSQNPSNTEQYAPKIPCVTVPTDARAARERQSPTSFAALFLVTGPKHHPPSAEPSRHRSPPQPDRERAAPSPTDWEGRARSVGHRNNSYRCVSHHAAEKSNNRKFPTP